LKLFDPIYDPKKSYQENFSEGPFGNYADQKVIENIGEPMYSFLGRPVYAPFGIGAGPLPNARFVKAAWDKGYDIVTMKSVRTGEWQGHPFPNVLPVEDKVVGEKEMVEGVFTANEYKENLTVANSVGVPSLGADVWQKELKEAISLKGKGQVLINAFNGTDRNEGLDAFIKDHIKGVEMLKDAGAEVIEINLSCPNEGNKGLLCFDVVNTKKILEAVNVIRGDTPLIVKIAYFKDKTLLEDFVKNVGPLVDGIVAINTLGLRVKTKSGEQAFLGSGREVAGVSGYAIKWAGLEMVRALLDFRIKHNLGFAIIGVGGVLSATDYEEYISSGADAVLSVTGAMWNPYLAKEIKEHLK